MPCKGSDKLAFHDLTIVRADMTRDPELYRNLKPLHGTVYRHRPEFVGAPFPCDRSTDMSRHTHAYTCSRPHTHSLSGLRKYVEKAHRSFIYINVGFIAL